MINDALTAAFKEVQKDLTHAIQQRDYWNIEVARLQQLSDGLEASIAKKTGRDVSVSPGASVRVGFTELVQSVVRMSGKEMSASDVRDSLKDSAYDLGEYANPLALIHQTLKRLAKAGRIDETGEGKYGAPEHERKLIRRFGTVKPSGKK